MVVETDSTPERELIKKLILTWHLNVPERRVLPSNGIRASLVLELLQEVVDESVRTTGFYPSRWRPDTMYSGGVIEGHPNNSYTIYWKAEISYGRYEIVKTDHCVTLLEACTTYMQGMYGKDKNIDGIPIDWQH